jgi:hypothetical protein
MDVLASLVAHLQPPRAVQPGQGALHHPAITPQSCAGVDSLARNSRDDVTLLQHPMTARIVIAFVRVQLMGSLPRPSVRSENSGEGVNHRLQHLRIVNVCSRMSDSQRDTLAVDHNVALRARFAPVRRIGAGFLSPPGAGTVPESSEARDQSIWSANPSRSSRTRWRLSHTPAACQSRKRRQQVIPLPPPISWGSLSHGIPVLSTKRIPVNAARFPMPGRPPFGLGGSGGNRGSIMAHSSSDTSCVAIRP